MSLGQLDLLAIPFARVGRAARGEYQTISISMFGFFFFFFNNSTNFARDM